MNKRLKLAWILAAALGIAVLQAAAQGTQQRDVMVSGQLTQGFDEGVNSSRGITNWVTSDSAVGAQKMSCPPAQDWCAMFVVFQKVVDPPRPGTDMSPYATLLVEMRGDSGKTIQIGVKDNSQPDNGTEQKVDVLLTANWRTYAIPLTRFSRANLKNLYVVCEFVWDANSPWTAWVRSIRFTTAQAASVDRVVNAASFQPGLVTGSWNSVTGSNLSAVARPWKTSDFQGNKLPTALDGVSVQIGERDMSVYYISPSQINTLVFGDVPTGPNYLTVTTSLGTSPPIPVTVQARFPAIFTIDPNNRYAAAVHLDGTIVGKPGLFGAGVVTRPAVPNETILVYGTGFGPTTPPLVQDELIQNPAPLADASGWQARIANTNAGLGFAGLSSSGLYQFNVTVPNVADGDQPLLIANGGTTSQAGVFITVQK
jgi:uncharacterized protein (TIGR03437 family)